MSFNTGPGRWAITLATFSFSERFWSLKSFSIFEDLKGKPHTPLIANLISPPFLIAATDIKG
jgi:hypothetical protein